MTILGIDNRTENWKTASHFAPLVTSQDRRKALAVRLGEPNSVDRRSVRLELFWKGVRDYIAANQDTARALWAERFVESYDRLFSTLAVEILQSGRPFRQETSRAFNYNPHSSDAQRRLLNNLSNTEIDIVMETRGSLYIGEAKDESGLDAKAEYVLVHQIIREYVMARILVDQKGVNKRVVPFVVVNAEDRGAVLATAQVGFMVDQKWLDKDHVLTWSEIADLR